MKWTDSDNLHARDALIIGGPADGLRIPAREQNGRIRYPDVTDLTAYAFNRDGWTFNYAPTAAVDD